VRATSIHPDTASGSETGVDAPPAPFSRVFVTITQQEHIELRLAAQQWRGLHRKAVARLDQQEVRHDRLVRELKAQALNRENPLAPFTAIMQKLVSRFGDGLGAGF